MPARGMNESGLTAESAAKIFSVTPEYKKKLAEFTARKADAEEAEAKLVDVRTDLVAEESELASRIEGVEKRESDIRLAEPALESRNRDCAAREATVDADRAVLDEREAALAGREKVINGAVDGAVRSLKTLLKMKE